MSQPPTPPSTGVFARISGAHEDPIAALEAQVAVFSQFAEASREAFWLLDLPTERIVFANPMLETLVGRPAAEFFDAPGRMMDWIHPDDHADAIGAFTTAANGIPSEVEYRFLLEDGAVRWVRVRYFPVRDDRLEIHRVAGVTEDVTERREIADTLRASERRFRALIEDAADAVVIIDCHGIVRYVSPAYARLVGWAEEDVVGQDGMRLVHPDDLGLAQANLGRVLAGPGATVTSTMRVRHRDGHWVTLAASAKSLCDEPAVDGVVVNLRDVTAEEALEAQLRQSQKMEAVGLLAGGVAHDFNNLLTVVGGYADFLTERLRDEPALAEDARQIRAAVGRAAQLTRQLLAVSRRAVVTPARVELNDVVDGVAPMLQRLLGEDVVLSLALAPEGAPVVADRGQLDQVLLNLALNARDAMPSGGALHLSTARIRTRGDSLLPAGDYVELVARDSGCGIPEEVQERIFEPFFTTKEPGQGTGLGLSVVYGIVRQAGGCITAESAPGAGATFRVRLPLAAAPAMPGPAPAEPLPVPAGRETVLVVEDEPEVREVARRILAAAGYTVFTARDASDALARMGDGATATVDLLLTDMVMPGLNGRELAERVRAARPATRVLLMTGYTDDDIVRRGLHTSGLRVLQKPFTVETLARAVREVLDQA